MQKLVFVIGQTGRDYEFSSTIANLYMNRFAINEDAGHEIVNIYEAFMRQNFSSEEEREQKGTDQIILTVNSHDGIV